MKLGTVALAGFITMGAIALPHLVTAQENQPAPVEPQQNDRRTAIAKINPKRPIQIRVVSQTALPVVASLIPAVGDRPVAPGNSVTFGRLHTSYLTLPIDLQVSLKETPDLDKPIGVYLDIKTLGNEIIISVKTSPTGTGNTSQSINVDQQGSIYRY
jgi:hypothetical protein